MFFFSPNVSSSFHLNEHNSCAKHFRKFFSLLSGSLRANFKRLYITNIMSNITTYIKITGNKLKYQLNSSVSHPQSCNHSLLRNHAVKFKFAGPPYVIITAYLPSMLKSSMHHGDRSSHHSHVELPESSSAVHITTGHMHTHMSEP